MDQILTEQDLNEVETWNKLSPHRWCLIVTRARSLLAQRDALKAERDTLAAHVKEMNDYIGSRAAEATGLNEYGPNLARALKAMKEELEQAKKEAEFDPNPVPVGHMIHIPAEYCGDSSRRHAYADGYLAGKGAK